MATLLKDLQVGSQCDVHVKIINKASFTYQNDKQMLRFSVLDNDGGQSNLVAFYGDYDKLNILEQNQFVLFKNVRVGIFKESPNLIFSGKDAEFEIVQEFLSTKDQKQIDKTTFAYLKAQKNNIIPTQIRTESNIITQDVTKLQQQMTTQIEEQQIQEQDLHEINAKLDETNAKFEQYQQQVDMYLYSLQNALEKLLDVHLPNFKQFRGNIDSYFTQNVDDLIAQSERQIQWIRGTVEKQPLVGGQIDLKVMQDQYNQNKFYKCFDKLLSRYNWVRKIRGDGNCFYRAFLFQAFDYFRNCKEISFQQFLNLIKDSKNDLINCGYNDISVNNLHELFLNEVHNLKNEQQNASIQHLLHIFSDEHKSQSLIKYARLMMACYFKKNIDIFQDFIFGGDANTFCMNEIEQENKECDHVQMLIISKLFGLGIEINALSSDGNILITKVPDEQCDSVVILLHTPGHYDALYP